MTNENKTKKILYVEDEAIYRKCFEFGLEGTLQSRNVSVDYASTEKEALEKIASCNYDVVVSDGALEVDGHGRSNFEGANVVKAAQKRGAYTIGLSTHPIEFKEIAGDSIDYNHQKPYDAKDLARLILNRIEKEDK